MEEHNNKNINRRDFLKIVGISAAKPEAHAGTLAVGAFHLQEAVHHRKQPCYNGKSQTYPLNILTSLFVHSQETRGYPRDVLLTHAGARVLDFNAQPAAVAVRFPADLYLHPSALCVLHRVGGQIVQYPGYANAVSMERPGNIRGEIKPQLDISRIFPVGSMERRFA